ncbi:KAP family P-loop NTPase fold protein [Mesobacillus persicus]|nr:P-loop NTPase fold protein [Mesobacillus persicus]
MKEIILQSSIVFILLIIIEKLLISSMNRISSYIESYWYFLPFLIVILFILLDEIRKRKVIKNTFRIPAFQLRADTIVISTLLAFLLYKVASNFEYAEGTLNRSLVYIGFAGGGYILWMVIRSIASYVHKKNKVKGLNEKLFLDYPIESDKDDQLDRSTFAKRISTVIGMRGYSEGLVIGLYGEWGSGKTSVLNLIENSLKDEVVFRFNPWFFENEKELIRQFFIQFGMAVRNKGGAEQSILLEKMLRIYGEKVASLKVNMGFASLSINNITSFFSEKSVSADTDIMELRELIIELLEKNGQGITVFIDDIDRLNRNETQTVFKLVKLIADFPYTAYILAFDDRLVAKSLANQYEDNSSQNKGDSFLEKIIQVPLHMPPADPAVLRSMVLSGIDRILELNQIELRKDEVHRFVSTWDRSIGHVISTPRMVKRYLNSLLFSIPLLNNEVNTVDQILIESLRVFYPDLYGFLRLNSDLFLTPGRSGSDDREKVKQYREKLQKVMQPYNKEERLALEILLQDLFPRTKLVFTDNTYYGHSWDRGWTKEQRICSSEYFDRFFKYTVPAGDVPDNWVKNLLTIVEEGQESEVQNEINKIIHQQGISRFIQKLRYIETSVPIYTARKLAETLVMLGSHYSRKDGAFGLVTTWNQAAILITNFMKRISKTERVDFSKHLLGIAQPLSFSKEILWWIHPSEKKNIDEVIHTEEEIVEIVPTLIKRIEIATVEIDFLDQYSTEQDVYGLLWIWKKWGTKGEVEGRIRSWFKEEKGVERFLCSFLSPSYNLETGIPHTRPFSKQEYDAVQALIPPDELYHQLEAKYECPADYIEDTDIENNSSYKRVAQQFMWIHRNQVGG